MQLTQVDAGTQRLAAAHGGGCHRMPGGTGDKGVSAARAKEARKSRVEHPARDEIARPQRTGGDIGVLDEQHPFRPEPASEPGCKYDSRAAQIPSNGR